MRPCRSQPYWRATDRPPGPFTQSDIADTEIIIELLELATNHARVEVKLDVKPKTIAARLYMQTLRLSRKKVSATYAKRIAQVAVEMADRYRRPANR